MKAGARRTAVLRLKNFVDAEPPFSFTHYEICVDNQTIPWKYTINTSFENQENMNYVLTWSISNYNKITLHERKNKDYLEFVH